MLCCEVRWVSAGYLHPHRCPLTEAAAAATVCTLALSHFMNVRHGRGGRVKEDRRHVSFKYQNEDLILMIIHTYWYGRIQDLYWLPVVFEDESFCVNGFFVIVNGRYNYRRLREPYIPFLWDLHQLHGMDGMHEWIHVGIVMLVLIKKEESECKRSLDANA